MLSCLFRPKVGRALARLLAVIPVAAAILGSGLTQPSVAAAADTTVPNVNFLKPTAGQVVKGLLNSPSGTGVITGGGVTFGNATVGASTNAPGTLAERKRVNSATPSQSGRVTKLSIYLQPGGATGTQVLRGVMYVDYAGSPGALLAVSDEQTLKNTLAAGWYDLTFPSSLAVTAGRRYWIGLITGATTKVLEYRYTSVASSRAVNTNTYTSGPSDPFSGSETVTIDDQRMSLYGTIAPTGSPVASVAPLLSDTASVGRYQLGDSLSTTNGTWIPAASTYTHQWQDCNSSGIQCQDIPGATSQTYTLANGDVGGTVRVVVAATNSTGSTSATSTVSPVVTATAPVSTARPVVFGSVNSGGTLTTTNGSWTVSGVTTTCGGSMACTYAWKLCSPSCSAISGATSSSYGPIPSGDVGDTIESVATATNSSGATSATSAQTGTIGSATTGGSGTITFDGTFTSTDPPNGPHWPSVYGCCHSYVASNQISLTPQVTSAGTRIDLCTSSGCSISGSGQIYTRNVGACTTIPFYLPNAIPTLPAGDYYQISEMKDSSTPYANWSIDIAGTSGINRIGFSSYSFPGNHYWYQGSSPISAGMWHTASLCVDNSGSSDTIYGSWFDGSRLTFNQATCNGQTSCTVSASMWGQSSTSTEPLVMNAYTNANGSRAGETVVHGDPLIMTIPTSGWNGLPPIPPGGWNSP